MRSKLIYILGFITPAVFVLLFAGFADIALAQNAQTYELIEPLPFGDEVPISGPAFVDYIRVMIQLTIGIATVLAVVMIVIGGLEYMTTDAVTGKSRARDRIQRAIGGLLLALAAFVILNTINPSLVEIQAIPTTDSEVSTNPGINIPSVQDAEWCVNYDDPNSGATNLDECSFNSGQECIQWVNNKGLSNSDINTYCRARIEGDVDFSSIGNTDPGNRISGWQYTQDVSGYAGLGVDYDSVTYVYYIFEHCNAENNTTDDCTFYDSNGDERAWPCEDCQVLSDPDLSLIRPRMKPDQCQWDRYEIVDEWGYNQICRLNSEFGTKLSELSERTNQGHTEEWRINEAWPPEVTHIADCHKIGTCADIGFTDKSNYSEENANNIAAFIEEAENNIATGDGLSVVFETSDPDLCSTVLSQDGIGPGDVHLLDLKPHFSVYNDGTANKGGGCD